MHNISHPDDQVQPTGIVGRWWRRLLGYPQAACCANKTDEAAPILQARGPRTLPGKWPAPPSHVVRRIAADTLQHVGQRGE